VLTIHCYPQFAGKNGKIFNFKTTNAKDSSKALGCETGTKKCAMNWSEDKKAYFLTSFDPELDTFKVRETPGDQKFQSFDVDEKWILGWKGWYQSQPLFFNGKRAVSQIGELPFPMRTSRLGWMSRDHSLMTKNKIVFNRGGGTVYVVVF
jgi:hypothetical protein